MEQDQNIWLNMHVNIEKHQLFSYKTTHQIYKYKNANWKKVL